MHREETLFKAEAAHSEIGTAEHRLLHAGIGDVIHLAVKKLGVPHGTDVHFLSHPFGTITRAALLLQAIGRVKAVAVGDERFLFGFFRVKRGDETRLAKKEIQMFNLVKVFTERIVGANREIGGDNRWPRAGMNLGLKKIRDDTALMVVPDPRICRWIWRRLCG